LIEALAPSLGSWEGRGAAPLDDLLRVLHTLKGGARLAGLRHLGELALELEQHLNAAATDSSALASLFPALQSGYERLLADVEQLRTRLLDIG
ncbi:Hpt domain-containing protein, partial [Pseudomonas sp. MOB-449]|nr:Hpt domain-containing protein [Pseudomonas sp. MOB-449]